MSDILESADQRALNEAEYKSDLGSLEAGRGYLSDREMAQACTLMRLYAALKGVATTK